MSLPLFYNEIGDFFGQSGRYGPLSPGLDFAFGFAGEEFIFRSKERGWLITDNGQTSPALYSQGTEINAEILIEPIKGLKILLLANRTDNRTSQVQFMFDDMPVGKRRIVYNDDMGAVVGIEDLIGKKRIQKQGF